MHLDAVLPIRSIALVHPAKALNFESPIAIRDGASNYSGVFHWRMLLVAATSPPHPNAADDSDNYYNPQNSSKYLLIHRNRSHNPASIFALSQSLKQMGLLQSSQIL
jgi:hypothetical protein